jgi:signal transduction histidine kinase
MISLAWHVMNVHLKHSLFIAVIFFTIHASLGQVGFLTDSLIVKYQNLTRGDTARMSVLTLIAQNQIDPNIKLEYAEILMEEARESNDLKFLHYAYLHQGQAYSLMGEFEVAIYALFKALDYAERAKYENGIAKCNASLADTYSLIGNSSSAISYYKKIIDQFQNNDNWLYANGLLNLGDEYYRIAMYDSAINCFRKSQAIYSRLKNGTSGVNYNKANLSMAYLQQGKYDLGEQSMYAVTNEFQKNGDYYGAAYFLRLVSKFYWLVGNKNKSRFWKASCDTIIARKSLLPEIIEMDMRFCDVFARSSDPVAAYQFYKQYTDLEEVSESAYTRIENLKSAFDLAKKQGEVELLVAEKKTQNIIVISAIVAAVALTILALVVLGYYRSKARTNVLLEVQKKKLENLNATKDKYFSIVSHDLRGSVSSFFGISRMIKFYVSNGKTNDLLEVADDIDNSVEQLSELLDNLLTWAMQQQDAIPVHFEKINAKVLLQGIVETLSNLAKGKNIHLTSEEISDDLSIMADRNTVMTVFRNLVNNALKFTSEGGKVVLCAEKDGDFIKFCVTDNGVGMDAEKVKTIFQVGAHRRTFGTSGEKGVGLGLQLVYEFTAINNGRVQVESKEGKGSVFTVWFPIG